MANQLLLPKIAVNSAARSLEAVLPAPWRRKDVWQGNPERGAWEVVQGSEGGNLLHFNRLHTALREDQAAIRRFLALKFLKQHFNGVHSGTIIQEEGSQRRKRRAVGLYP